jgi:O-acetyl-ADP-ribose deacetylase (regulator of RNase III)
MKTVEGDLIKLALEGEFDVIVHGCNCFCTMGAGIAKQIKAVFPEAYEVDLDSEEGDKEKLGSYTSVRVQRNDRELVIINAYTQYNWRGKGPKADYDAIAEVMKRIKNDFHGLRIGYPLLGAGLAGGDWEIISQIIGKELVDENHCLVKFKS